MSSKYAYLVLGPESSGTRLMTKLLMAAGCYGDEGHVQRLDQAIPRAHELGDVPGIVWRRSVPHDRQWPDIPQLLLRLDAAGYTPVMVVLSRDWHAMSLSQVAARHVADVTKALSNIQMAYRTIFGAAGNHLGAYILVNYESLVLHPRATVAALLSRLGLPVPAALPPVYDGNAKYCRAAGNGATLRELAGEDAETVRAAIAAQYGIEVTDAYARDFVAFWDEVAQEMNL